jgi:subtilisin-like proprotein convertase family protein
MRLKTICLFATLLLGLSLPQHSSAAAFTGSGTGNIPDSFDDGPAVYTGELVVSFDVTGVTNNIQSLWLAVTLRHQWVGDLDVFLTSPAGTNFTIFSRVGASVTNEFFGDNAQLDGTYTFFDYATNTLPIIADSLEDPDNALESSTNFIPAGYFLPSAAGPGPQSPTTFAANSGFIGLTPAQANGTWTLTFRDGSAGDTGVVSTATLYLNEPTPLPPPLRFTRIAAANGTAQLNLTGPFNENFTLWSSTNLAEPFANWETSGSGTFDDLGNATLSTNATTPQRFFLISVP